MPYDYERSVISRATGLTGVEAAHIAKMLNKLNVDPQVIDWHGAISDARDYGNRYEAVKTYIRNYYGIDVDSKSTTHYNPEQYEMGAYLNQAATKQGVKQLLKEFYSTNSKQKKAQIREILLSEGPLSNVLMTAMYNGTDLPNAKKFLGEAVGQDFQQQIRQQLQQPVKQPVKKPVRQTVEKRAIIVQPAFAPPPKQPNNALVERRNNAILLPKGRGYRIIKNGGNGKKKDEVNIDDLQRLLMMEEHLRNKPGGPPRGPPGYRRSFKEGIKHEARLWQSLFSGGRAKDPAADLKLRVEQLRLANEPLRLKMEHERLLMQREQMQQLAKLQRQRQRTTTTSQYLSWFGFMPPHMMEAPLQRPGYFIEARPKLPAGYRWKKIPQPKGRKKQNNIMIY